ncbi:hypothetical protein TELCIR_12904 [Teladorsagia circumcincta]|uniref:Surfactant protein B n=1 Tax=Teladorsagia circumcincta TaxID=45464 RepID=A0A2G9U5I9_TELCI|nr:hypothetical protein TELCIR_12904 [Teladorsagia circumcincta]
MSIARARIQVLVYKGFHASVLGAFSICSVALENSCKLLTPFPDRSFLAYCTRFLQILRNYGVHKEDECMAALSKDVDKVYAQIKKQSAEAFCKAYKICK